MRGMLDILSFGIIIIVFAIFFIFSASMFPGILSDFNESVQSEEGHQAIDTSINMFYSLDGLFTALTLAGIIGMIIGFYLLRSHPILFIASLILTIFFIFTNMLLSNLGQDIIYSQELNQTSQLFPSITFITDNLPLISIFVFIIGLVLLYSSRRSSW